MRMRRVKNINCLMFEGDFVFVEIEKRGVRGEAFIAAYNSREAYIYQDMADGHNYRGRLPYDVQSYLNSSYVYGWLVLVDEIERNISNDGWTIVRYLNDNLPFEYEDARGENLDGFFLDNYTRENEYTGFKTYHSTRVMNQPIGKKNIPYRIGIELEVEFASTRNRDIFCNMPSNYIFREDDASLRNAGCEIITIPLLPKDAKSFKTWQPIVDKLTELGARSWDTNRCGLHCHFSREMFGKDREEQMENIVKMCYFYDHILHDDTTNTAIYGRSYSYHEEDGKTAIGGAIKTLGSDVLKHKDIRKRVLDASKTRHEESRYFDINLKPTNTIEFRKGRGSINASRIISIIEYNELIALFCKKTKIMELTLDNFKEFVRKSIKPSSPLTRYFDGGER